MYLATTKQYKCKPADKVNKEQTTIKISTGLLHVVTVER